MSGPAPGLHLTSGMNTLLRRAAVLLLLMPASARADILLLDVNDQEGERKAVQKLAKQFGEDANLVLGAKTKDFLVFLEIEFAKAERGETDVETIVFSGHSPTGREFKSEDGDREIMLAHLAAMAPKYPKAFAQVRHVMLMGCMAGVKDDIGSWSGLFPNVVAAAGFNGVGPSGRPSEQFLKSVLRDIKKREKAAGGIDAFAALLADDQAAIDGWAKTLASLDAVQKTEWGLELCGSYHTNQKMTEDTPARLSRLLNDAYFACRDAHRSCKDPLQKKAQLRELYLGTEKHVRPGSTNVALVDSQQKKVYKLLHYDDFAKGWIAKNGARLDNASRRIPGFPSAATFAASDRAAQLDAARVLQETATSADLAALAADMDREFVQLK